MDSSNTTVSARLKRRLARKPDIGTVNELQTGVIEIVFEGQAMTIPAARYWTFMELMSEAAQRFVAKRATL